MIKILLPVIYFLSIASSVISQGIIINSDTISISIKDKTQPIINVRMNTSALYKGKYYCVFNEDCVYPRISDARKHLFFFTIGEKMGEICLPKELLSSYYFDLFVQDNMLLLKDYYTHNTYFLDTNKQVFKKQKEVDDVIYEDSLFYVTYLDYGEWGCTTWFHEKKTGNEYELAYGGYIINKLNDAYYLITSSSVIKIDDPHKLVKVRQNRKYKKAKKGKLKFYEGSKYFEGAEMIFEDTTYYPFLFNSGVITINTSFVQNNRIYFICTDSSTTFIAVLKDKKFVPIKFFDKKMLIVNNYYSYRNKINENRQLLNFVCEDDSYGLIDINPPEINIHYLLDDVDSALYVGTSAFKTILDYVSLNLTNLNIEKIDSIETLNKGIDVKQNKEDAPFHYLFRDKEYIQNIGIKTYFNVEDSIFASTRSYGYNSEDSMLYKVVINWFETELFDDNTSIFNLINRKQDKVFLFKAKLKEIEIYLSNKYGQAVDIEQKYDNYRVVKWKLSNGVIMQLTARDLSRLDEIELMIFLEK